MANEKPATAQGMGMDGMTIAHLQKGLTIAHLGQAMGGAATQASNTTPASASATSATSATATSSTTPKK